ncbi:MAG: hypothetical protein WBH90_12695 [Aggregatilineales bacterium]|nr:hypothetical protein [Chloroflexota bacterium]HOA24274.1 hypothetical protein [Aggregatilineales bacterium]HPV06117.1 hypothetical protein [Aggregatilineales bacterium]HQE18128.1 hypothetical protein [Aggregatilineales bacterium]
MRLSRFILQLKTVDWQAARQALRLGVVLLVLLVAVPGLRPDPNSPAFQSLGYARDYLFDFVSWEAQALFDKLTNAIIAPQRFMPPEEQTRFVRDYLALVAEIQRLEQHVFEIYSDPMVEDPEEASYYIRVQRDEMRTEQQRRQAIAEAIVEAQVAEVLVDYGFGPRSGVWPPVAIRFTQLPTVLIISPRDRIERIGGYPLQHGITVEERERIEANVDADLGVSSLVTPIGGLAMWPAMLVETSYLPAAYDVSAHEWAHHYLAFYPMGFNYGTTPELYTLNETVASIVGAEISWAVLDRYYPDLAPPPPDYTPIVEEVKPVEPLSADEPPVFDFRAEMRETRIRVDNLLAEGRIEEAERYMEMRRQQFVANGYQIRKLNQAYFAFHGSYADAPGATGADPIGPALRELRYYSGSLVDFVAEVRDMTTYQQVVAALESHRALAAAEGYGTN